MEDLSKKSILEALIFISDRPLMVLEIKEVLDGTSDNEIKDIVNTLNQDYEQTDRSFRITETAGGYRMETEPKFGPWLKKLYKSRMKEKLTKPSLETLAIIAYRQPVTRAEIEAIRGVNADGVVRTLLERGLIKISGRKEAIGRPILYSTTREFLEHFGLTNIADLPKMEEMPEPKLEEVSEQATQEEGVEYDASSTSQENQ